MPDGSIDIPGCIVEERGADTGLHADRCGTISVDGAFEAVEVPPGGPERLRPDIFREGRFSAFDALVWACGERGIALEHHYDEALAAHVIDTLDGRPDWWYAACYHGCHRCEEPAHRTDTYPWRDWTRVEVYQVAGERIGQLCGVFRTEVERLAANGGRVIVPEVTVTAEGLDVDVHDVEVRAHGLRSDIFQPDVVTAADIMLSLGEAGALTFDLDWKEHVGKTLVQNYHFSRFDGKSADGLAGFTYELGEKSLSKERPGRFGNNHFHMMSDIRAVVSPEYAAWHWTDLSGRR